MGWQNAHLHQFRIGDRCYGPNGTDLDLVPEDGIRLDQIITTDLAPGTQTVLDYLYDPRWTTCTTSATTGNTR